MRILFTTAWYPNRKVAGDGVFIQKHAQAISRMNDVAVLMVQTDVAVSGLHIELCPNHIASVRDGFPNQECDIANVRDGFPDPKCDIANVRDGKSNQTQGILRELLVYVPKTRFEVPLLTGILRLMWLMLGYLKGYRYIKKHWWNGQRPEVCHVNVLTRAAGLPWLLLKIHHIPYIITEHWTRYARPDSYPESKMQLKLGRLFVRDAAYVCPVSLNLEQSMKQWGLVNRNYTRIGNVVDTEVFELPESSILKPNREVSFVHVSWMRDPAKNISGILRVLARLKAAHLPFHMNFIGEGNDKERLIKYAEELNLTGSSSLFVQSEERRECLDCVNFLEAKKGQELAAELQRHDAMVMFSNFENQPVSILEALSCGLPVIATKIAAIPSMLANNRGITVEAKNEDQLFEVLSNFIKLYAGMTDAQRADSTLAQQRHQYVVEHHSPEVIAHQFDALYHSALSKV